MKFMYLYAQQLDGCIGEILNFMIILLDRKVGPKLFKFSDSIHVLLYTYT